MSFVWRKRLFILLFPLLLALTYWQIRIESDLNAFFTATDSEESALLAGFLQSGEMSRRYLAVVESLPGNEGAAVLDRFTADLVARLSRLDGVERVWRMDEPPRGWADAVQAYAPYGALIHSLEPQAGSAFDPTRLPQRAQGLRSALLSPQGGFLKPIARQDPLLLSLQGFRGLQGKLEGGGVGQFILQARAPSLDVAAQAQLQNDIRKQFDDQNLAQKGAFKLSMTGIPVFTVAASGEISRDVTLVSAVSSIGVTLVFLLLFRSFAALHWMLLIQAASFAAGALATALFFGNVHSLTLALGASLIGICTDYPIHVLVHSAKSRFVSPLQAARLVWPSLVMGGLTTLVGYGALGLTGFPGLEQIAVFAVGGIASSLFLTRWVLPALLGATALHPAHLPGINGWIAFCDKNRRLLAWLLLALSIAAAMVLPRMRWMDDLQKLSVDMSELRAQDQAIRSRIGSIEPGRFVLVQGPDLETALQRSEAAERRLRRLQDVGGLAEYHGIFPWLVSQRLQHENAQVYRTALTPQFKAAWRAALAATGLSVDKLGEPPDPPAEGLNAEALLGDTEVAGILSGQVIRHGGGVSLAIWLGQHDPMKVEAALQGLEGVRYFSQRDVMNRVAAQHRDRSLEMLAWGIAVMALMIWLQQRSLRRVLLTLLPSLASVLFIFAAWAVMGEEVSFLHVIGLLLSVSLCVDYGIFFMDNRGHDTDITYHAIASSTLTTLASFGALALARTPTLPILSVSVTLGVTLGFLLCPLLVSASKMVPVPASKP